MKRYSKDPYCRCSMEPNALGAWVMFDDVKPLALPLTNTAADGEVKGDVRELRQMLADCAQYLKEGETPAQRIERERRDTEAALNLLIREKQKTERLRATLQEIGAAAVSQPCPQLDKPTDFAISQSRGMQLAMIARATDEALGA